MSKFFTPKNVTVFFVALAFFSPMLFTLHGLECFNFNKTGAVGDTIGGLTAPFIGVLNAILLYMTLKRQDDELNRSEILRRQDEARRDKEMRILEMQRTEQKLREDINRSSDYIERQYESLKLTFRFHDEHVIRDEEGNKQEFIYDGAHFGRDALTIAQYIFYHSKPKLSHYNISLIEWGTFRDKIILIINEIHKIVSFIDQSELNLDSKILNYHFLTIHLAEIHYFLHCIERYGTEYPDDEDFPLYTEWDFLGYIEQIRSIRKLNPAPKQADKGQGDDELKSK